MDKKQEDFIDKNVKLNIKFEFINANEEIEYSKEYKVDLLFSSSFEENEINLLMQCDFRTVEERIYYHMFDNENNLFIIRNKEFLQYINNEEKTLIFKNCLTFINQIIRLLDEEYENIQKEKETPGQFDANSIKRSATLLSLAEGKKLNGRMVLFNLSKNYFDVGIFGEEFIKNDGIKHLLSLIEISYGNIRAYALNALNKVFSFESSFAYIEKHQEIIKTIFEILMTSDTPNCNKFAFNAIIQIIGNKERNVKYLIDIFEQYAKKTNTKVFTHLIQFLTDKSKDYEIKLNTLTLINILLNYCDQSKVHWLLIQLREVGLFDMLEKLNKYKEKKFQEQLTNFLVKSEKIVGEQEYEVEIYKHKIKEMKSHCEEIENQCNYEKVNQLFYNTLEEYFAKYQKICDVCIYYSGINAPSKRMVITDKNINSKVTVNPTGIVDIEKLFEDTLKKDEKKILDKYETSYKESEELKAKNNELEEAGKIVTNEQIKDLENKLKIEKEKEETLLKKKEETIKKINELAGKAGKIEKAPEITPSEQSGAPVPPPPPPPPLLNTSGSVPPPPPGIIPGPPSLNLTPKFVAKPTKPKITLKKKVKGLGWNRVLLLPKEAPNRPNLIWNDMKEYELDINEVVSLFEAKLKPQLTKTEEETKVNRAKKFLDDKRTQAVLISLAKLPQPEIISRALSEMDENTLDKNKIDSLLSILITKEELDQYNSIGPGVEWDKGEKYLIKINEIPNHKEKLKLWSLILEFGELYSNIGDSFNYLIPACDEIKNNKYFKEILSVILGLGNILNGGTSRGQADGFSLDILSKIYDTKDSLGNSMLNWICEKTHKDNPSFEGFKNQFPQLEKAADVSLDELNRITNELKGKYNQMNKLLNDIKIESQFNKKAKSEVEDIKLKVDLIEKKLSANNAYYEKIVQYYGYNKKDKFYTDNVKFFKMLLQFFDKVNLSMPKLDIKKVLGNEGRSVGKKVDQQLMMNELKNKLRMKFIQK